MIAMREDDAIRAQPGQPRELAGALDRGDEQRADLAMPRHGAKPRAPRFEQARGAGVDELPGHG